MLIQYLWVSSVTVSRVCLSIICGQARSQCRQRYVILPRYAPVIFHAGANRVCLSMNRGEAQSDFKCLSMNSGSAQSRRQQLRQFDIHYHTRACVSERTISSISICQCGTRAGQFSNFLFFDLSQFPACIEHIYVS